MPRSPTFSRQAKTICKFTKKVGDLNLCFLSFLLPSYLEAIAKSNARAIQSTANKLDEKFDQIANAVIRRQDRLERLERRDRKVDKEIRGLRIETRRILECWLGEPFPDDPDLDEDEAPSLGEIHIPAQGSTSPPEP
jgi:hypothetical protein